MEFPRVAPFNARIRHSAKLENYAYRCPHCKVESFFTLDDVKRSHGARQSRLKPEAQRLYDASYPIRSYADEFYYDFHCDGCLSPVRVYFEAFEQAKKQWEYYGSFVMELRRMNLFTPPIGSNFPPINDDIPER